MNQTLTVIYQNKYFTVNSSLLAQSSRKFSDLIHNYGQDLQYVNLRIVYDKFSPRNISSFLRVCQNQPTYVQNSEIEEICLIAKMFQADEILNKGLEFVKNNIDPSFNISDDQFTENHGNCYLVLEKKETESPTIIKYNFNDLKLENDFSKENDSKNNNNKQNQQKKSHPVHYQITSDTPFMKRSRFYLIKNGEILYKAKQTDSEIFIGDGENFHIKDKKYNDIVKITRKEGGCDIVDTNDQQFKIKFWKLYDIYSMTLSFIHKGEKVNWHQKNKKNINGEYISQPSGSKKNIILLNQKNQPTYCLRKISKKDYEIECHPEIDPVIVFSIAVSEIIGPIF